MIELNPESVILFRGLLYALILALLGRNCIKAFRKAREQVVDEGYYKA